MRLRSSYVLLAALAASLILAACGGGGGSSTSTPPPPPITVTVTPATAKVNAGLSAQFTATVANSSNTAVNWAVSGGGSITATGLYTAPATPPSGAVTVTATAQADSTKSGTATVTVLPAVAVSVNPATAQVYGNQTQQFTATVANNTNGSVTWAVTGGAANGTITTGGLYTAPATPPGGAVTITATAQADAKAIGSAQVTVLDAITVTVSAAAGTVNAGLTDQFTATVGPTGISQSVTWQVNGVTGGDSTNGTISASGLYTAPATPPAMGTVQITATSVTGAVASAPYTLTVAPAVTVSISAQGTPPAVLVAGTSETFTATVSNTSNQNVTWEVNGIAGGNSTVGTITAGVYTAPRLLPPGGGVEIAAVAQADPNATGSALVTDGWANVSLKGNYVFAIQGTSSNGCTFAEMGQFSADGTDSSGPNGKSGNITGEADLNVMASTGPPACSAKFAGASSGDLTGTYAILPDGRGGVQFATAPEGTNLVFAITLDANGNVRLVEQDTNAVVTGGVWAQTSTAALSGTYVYGLPEEIGRITAAAGIWAGAEDNDPASGPAVLDAQVSGTFGAPDASGRGTMTLTASGGTAENYVFYTVSAGRVEVMRSDAGTLAIGRADTQDTTPFNAGAFTGGYVFQYAGTAVTGGQPVTAAGWLTADGKGDVTNGAMDERLGTGTEPGQTFAASTYTAAPSSDGEYTVHLGTHTYAVWMYSATGGEMLETDGNFVAQGTMAQQQNGPFGTNALYGEYALQLNGSDGTRAITIQGELAAAGGVFLGQADAMVAGAVTNNLYLTGSYSVNSSSGEAEGTLLVCSAQPTVNTACPSGTQVSSTAVDFWIGTASQSSTGTAASGTAFLSGGSSTGYWAGTLTQQY